MVKLTVSSLVERCLIWLIKKKTFKSRKKIHSFPFREDKKKNEADKMSSLNSRKLKIGQLIGWIVCIISIQMSSAVPVEEIIADTVSIVFVCVLFCICDQLAIEFD